MKMSDYKIGDRVKYIFLGDYEGVVTQEGKSIVLIELDKPAPVQFNTGSRGVMALGPSYLELID